MLLTTTEINNRYTLGLGYLTNITFNKFLKDKYGVQYKSTSADRKLLLLLYALDSWDNRVGATNWLTETQIMAILDNIASGHRDPLTSMTTTSGSCCSGGSTSMSFQVSDTESIHLTYVNGVLKAAVIVSPQTNNSVAVQDDGVYGTPSTSGGGGGESAGGKIFLTGADFVSGTNQYINSVLAGKASISLWHRGLGFLLYDFDDPTNTTNEYTIDAQGITITIPGFDVHDGVNFFYILY